MNRLFPDRAAVVVVDVQDKLAAAMPEAQMQQVARSVHILAEGARAMGGTVLFTEQYPKGLGATVAPVAECLEAARATRFEKTAFSACEADGFADALRQSGAGHAVVVGMESHVCVFQTVRDLVALGLDVHVPIDGVASRRDDHRARGLALSERAGAVVTTTETIAFDWLRSSEHPAFRQLSKLIR